jgi:uncharacterized protein YggE
MDAYIDVTGAGTASGTPDVVVLDVRVNVEGADVAPTLREASRLMAAVHEAARAAGIEERHLRTTSAGVNQRWANDGSGPIGHTAWQSAQVRVPSGTDVGPVIEACNEAAGNAFALDSLTLTVDDPEPLLRRAREAAFADARTKAEQLAHLAGRSVGRVVAITDGASGGPFPVARDMSKRLMSAEASGMPVAPGETSVGASIAVRFAWAD